MLYSHSHSQSGYSMVEVLVAISILLLATVGPMTIAARSMQYAQFSGQQNTAFLLAQEGIEAVFAIRAEQSLAHLADAGDPPVDSWEWTTFSALDECFESEGCGIDWVDETLLDNVVDCTNLANCRLYFDETASRARFSHTVSDIETPYTRVVNIVAVSAEVAQVTSVVSWTAAGTGQARSVRLQTYLHNIYDSTN